MVSDAFLPPNYWGSWTWCEKLCN